MRERLEQLTLLSLCDANAGVGHGKHQACVTALARHLERLNVDMTPLGELDGVADQVGQHLAQAGGITQVQLVCALPGVLETQPFLVCGCGKQRPGVMQQLRWTERNGFEVELSCLDLGKVKDVIQDGLQRLPGAEQGAGVVLTVHLCGLGIHQQLGHAHDAVHRCANLMGHGRQKLALGLVGRFGHLFGLRQLGDRQRQLPGLVGHALFELRIDLVIGLNGLTQRA